MTVGLAPSLIKSCDVNVELFSAAAATCKGVEPLRIGDVISIKDFTDRSIRRF